MAPTFLQCCDNTANFGHHSSDIKLLNLYFIFTLTFNLCVISAWIQFILSPELYSYTEEPEFALNRDYFEEDFRSHGTVL